MKPAAALVLGTGLLTACSPASGDAPLRLGFFPTITHATALVGVKKGIFARRLGRAPTTLTFNAGPAAAEAVFSGLLALDRLSLDVWPGEFVCVLGASGCGKSTLLSVVAGLDRLRAEVGRHA